MGSELASFAQLAFTGISAASAVKQGKGEAQAIVRQGELQAKEKAKEVRHRAARQTSSFLNSGLTLEGTPEAVIAETFATGIEDIEQIRLNANLRSKNAIGGARARAISKIASGFSGTDFSSLFSGAASALPEKSLFSLNKSGQGNLAFEALELKDIRGVA